jgi:hypothetical protein
MSEGEALQVLGMSPLPDGSISEDELRRAYRCVSWLAGWLAGWLAARWCWCWGLLPGPSLLGPGLHA